MKKISYVIFLIFLFSKSYSQFIEDFTGVGPVTSNGWSNHNGTLGEIYISSGSLNYNGISNYGNKLSIFSGGSEDVNKSIGTPISDTFYCSFITNVRDLNGLKNVGEYSVHFSTTNAISPAALPLPHIACVYFKPGSIVNTFNIGIKNLNEYSINGGPAIYDQNNFQIDVPLFVVVKFEIASQIVSLFINPILGDNEPLANVTDNSLSIPNGSPYVGAVAIRQSGTIDSGTGNIDFDSMRISNNWELVTSSTLSTDGFEAKNKFKVYPNPTNGVILISSATLLNEKCDIEICNLLGERLFKSFFIGVEHQIDLSFLQKGAYFLKIKNDSKFYNRKIIVN